MNRDWMRWLLPTCLILMVLVVVFFVRSVGSHIEWKEVKTVQPPRGEARQDRFFAARLLLEKSGYSVRRPLTSLPVADLSLDTTFFYIHLIGEDSVEKLEPAVVDWVKRGGHLVVIVPGPNQSDQFTESLGLSRLGRHASAAGETYSIEGRRLALDFNRQCDVFQLGSQAVWGMPASTYAGYADTDQPSDESADDDEGRADDDDEGRADTDTEHDSADAPAQNAPAQRSPEPADSAWKQQQTAHPEAPGLAAARWRLGKGVVSAVCEDRWMENASLGKLDHAELVLRLFVEPAHPKLIFGTVYDGTSPAKGKDTKPGGPSRQSREPPPLIKWLFHHAWSALIALAVLIALVLWRAMPRFGAILPEPPPARPGLREHLRAMAGYFLREKDYLHLLTAMREEFKRMAIRHANTAELPLNEIAELAGLKEDLLREALEATPEDRFQFQRHAEILALVMDVLRARRPMSRSHSRSKNRS